MTIWLTSDWHLSHKRILELSHRPFDDTDHMNSAIISNFNSVVGPEDTTYFLGDMVMGGWKDHIHNIRRLNGRKILVSGNHDQPFIHRGKASFERVMDGYLEHFDEVHLGSIELDEFTLSHFPYDADHTDDPRYMEFRPVDEGRTLIHGHLHEEDPEKQVTLSSKGTIQIHVGVDGRSFFPVSIDQIRKEASGG